jgi:hypothetical protein
MECGATETTALGMGGKLMELDMLVLSLEKQH